MEISPQSIRSVEFRSTKKGYDPDEVDAFKDHVASLLEDAQQQAATMEARARAAIAKLQELAAQPSAATSAAAPVVANETEIISRTLVLAQRTADAAIAEARAEADTIVQAARDESARAVDAARHAATKVADEARIEARRSMEDERLRAESEVQSLLARRDFLLSDVDQLEQYIELQRERMREVAAVLHDLTDRVPGGLGEMRRPLMSASATPHAISEPRGPVSDSAPVAASAELPEVLPIVAAAPEPVEDVAAAVSEPAATGSDRDDVWRILDETGGVSVPPQQPARTSSLRPVAPTLPTLDEQLQGGLFTPDAITAEVPVIGDGFRIGGDDLR